MNSRLLSSTVIALALIAGVTGAAGLGRSAHGRSPNQAQEAATLGVPTTVRVRLVSPVDGKPAGNTPVVFHTDATLGRVADEVELGRAVTNADGVAELTFEPHIAGDHEIRVDFEDVGKKVNLGKVTLTVTGDEQLIRSTAGVRIPGLNVWLLIALIAAIWSILLSVSIRVIAIARGEQPRSVGRAQSGTGRSSQGGEA